VAPPSTLLDYEPRTSKFSGIPFCSDSVIAGSLFLSSCKVATDVPAIASRKLSPQEPCEGGP
jgi:hypothetical protein